MSTRKSAREKKSRNANLDTRKRKLYFDLVTTDPKFKILYLLPHSQQNLAESSAFGWYTKGLHQAANLLIKISELPVDIREPFSTNNTTLLCRLTRRIHRTATPLTISAFTEIADEMFNEYPFRVVITTDPAIALQTDQIIGRNQHPTLHVSTEAGEGRIHPNLLHTERLIQYFREVVRYMEGDSKWTEFATIANSVMDPNEHSSAFDDALPLSLHNLTTPNEVALKAFGWNGGDVSALKPSATRQQYINRICLGADAVSKVREQLTGTLPPHLIPYRYILAVQSMYWGHFRNSEHRISQADPDDRKLLKFIFSESVGKTTYTSVATEENIEYLHNPIFLGAAAEMAADARSFTAGLSLLASETLTPVLRLEPKLNQIRGDLKQLAMCARSFGKHHRIWKMSQGAFKLGEKMRDLVADEFLNRIDAPSRHEIEGMKLVADVPLEFITSNGIALALRFDVSRIPVLPGNMYLASTLRKPQLIPQSEFLKILVIRSFQPNDPLRNILQISLQAALPQNSRSKINVRFVDVASEDQFIDALNSYDGAVMIFDGHGTYNPEIGEGSLVIGGRPMNAWALRERCHLPPVVIFSACDTQPIDGSHSSVATAAFTLGAHAVLGTMLPVDGRYAGVFLGRLFLRLAEFMPLAIKHRRILTWREMVSGLQRMMHVTEVIRVLQSNVSHFYPRDTDTDEVQLTANIAINSRRPDWYEIFLKKLASVFNRPLHAVTNDVQKWGSMSEALKYVQLGNPESIIIIDNLPTT